MNKDYWWSSTGHTKPWPSNTVVLASTYMCLLCHHDQGLHFFLLLPLIYVTNTHVCHEHTAWHIHGPPLTWMSLTIPEGRLHWDSSQERWRRHGLGSHGDSNHEHSFCLLWSSISVDSHFLSSCIMYIGSTHALLWEHTYAFLFWDCSYFVWCSLCLDVPGACSSWLL